jgi:hypothetical protein
VHTSDNAAGATAAALISVMLCTYSNHNGAEGEADGVDTEAASVQGQ